MKNRESFVEVKSVENSVKKQNNIDSASVIQTNKVKSNPIQFVKTPVTPAKRKMECMYWNGENYAEVFCDELIEGREIIALNEEKKLIKKITKPDTLTVENALGKVWYDKSNGKVEFFTHYGIHPENGKTLKEVTPHILEVYTK